MKINHAIFYITQILQQIMVYMQIKKLARVKSTSTGYGPSDHRKTGQPGHTPEQVIADLWDPTIFPTSTAIWAQPVSDKPHKSTHSSVRIVQSGQVRIAMRG